VEKIEAGSKKEKKSESVSPAREAPMKAGERSAGRLRRKKKKGVDKQVQKKIVRGLRQF